MRFSRIYCEIFFQSNFFLTEFYNFRENFHSVFRKKKSFPRPLLPNSPPLLPKTTPSSSWMMAVPRMWQVINEVYRWDTRLNFKLKVPPKLNLKLFFYMAHSFVILKTA